MTSGHRWGNAKGSDPAARWFTQLYYGLLENLLPHLVLMARRRPEALIKHPHQSCWHLPSHDTAAHQSVPGIPTPPCRTHTLHPRKLLYVEVTQTAALHSAKWPQRGQLPTRWSSSSLPGIHFSEGKREESHVFLPTYPSNGIQAQPRLWGRLGTAGCTQPQRSIHSPAASHFHLKDTQSIILNPIHPEEW